VILFKSDMAQAILEGRKTVTRRRGKRRWRVGSIHQCYTRPAFAHPPGKPFARVLILAVEAEERPGASLAAIRKSWVPAFQREARREGFRAWPDFADAWLAMHGEKALGEPCWRVAFSLVEAMPEAGDYRRR